MKLVDDALATALAADEVNSILRDDNSIEGILMNMDFITEDQLRQAVAIQCQQSPLGEILVDMGAITQYQLDEAHMLQKISRGEASDAEAAGLYRLQRKRLVQQIVTTLRETSDAAEALSASYKQ